MQDLRANTEVIVTIGPFVDVGDGFTPETGITLGAADEAELIKHGSTSVVDISGATWAAVTSMDGYYSLTLTTSHTDTEGQLTVVVQDDSVCLPVKQAFRVLSEAAYDSLYAAKDTGYMDVNIKAISDDETAPDNLEAMYDGTGYTDATGPASRSQISALSVGSGGISTTASTAVITVGTETLTYTATQQQDGIYHELAVDTTIDFYYQFNIGATGVPIECKWVGYVQGNNDEVEVYAYNYGSTSYEQIGSISGTSGTTVQSLDFIMTTAHVGTGANLGLVRLRFESSGGDVATVVATDRVLCEYTVVSNSLGFVNGAVWVDTNTGTSGTGEGVGTITVPSDNLDDALTIAVANNLKDIHVAPGSTVTPTGAVENYEILGHEYTIALNGQSWAGTYISGATISGTATGSSIQLSMVIIDSSVTLPACIIRNSFFGDMTITLGTGDYFFNNCIDRATGLAAPNLEYGAAVGNTNVNLHGYAGAIEIENMGDSGTDTLVVSGDGRFIGNANCTSGTVTLLGTITESDASGNLTITKAISLDNVNAEVDTALTDYDPPTRTEATADKNAIITQGNSAWTTGSAGGDNIEAHSTEIRTS